MPLDQRGRLAQVIEPVKDLPVLLRQRRKRLRERFAALLFDHLLPEAVERDERIVLQREIDVLFPHGLRRLLPGDRAEPRAQLAARDIFCAAPQGEKDVRRDLLMVLRRQDAAAAIADDSEHIRAVLRDGRLERARTLLLQLPQQLFFVQSASLLCVLYQHADVHHVGEKPDSVAGNQKNTRCVLHRTQRAVFVYSTVTLLARLRGLSISQPRCSAT